MPSSLRLLAALLLAAAPVSAGAAETDAPADSLFKAKAELLDHLALLKLKLEVQQTEKALGENDLPKPSDRQVAPPKASVPPYVLVEITGSSGTFTAGFRSPDGSVVSAAPHDTVPGFGQIRTITATSVQSADGHWHSVTAEPGP